MTDEKELDYKTLFGRNYGIFTEEEQEGIRNGKVAMIGCGGIGGAMALALARSGVENFVLVDPDIYEASNMNRQMSCRVDTLGEKKVDATKEDIHNINPNANVETYPDPELDDLDEIIEEDLDVLVGVADDFPYAIIAMRKAKKKGIDCVTAYPTGALVRVTTFLADGPEPEEAFGLPQGLQYETLHDLMFSEKNRKRFSSTLEFYKEEGDWREDWFEEFLELEKPFPQITPFVWTGSSLGSLEVLKLLSGKWEPMACPKHFKIQSSSAEVLEFDPPGIREKLGSILLKLKEKF